MNKQITGYERKFDLPSGAGSLVRFMFYSSGIGLIIIGLVLGIEKVGSRRYAETIFHADIFLPFLVYGILAIAVGYVAGRLVDIQHLKLQLLEMQTKVLLVQAPDKEPTAEKKQ